MSDNNGGINLGQLWDDYVVDTVENVGGGRPAVLMNQLEELPGARDFFNTIRSDDSPLAGGVEISEAQQVAMLERLQVMAEDDPAIFTKLNTVLDADGASEFFQNVQSNPAFADQVGDIDLSTITAERITQIAEEITEDPQLFERANNLLARPGFNEFLENVAEHNIVDVDFTDLGQSSEMIAQLDALAQADNNVFLNINTIMDADGFDEILSTVRESDSLSSALTQIVGSSELGGAEGATAIASFANTIRGGRPDYLVEMNGLIERNPGAVDLVAGMAANNPRGAVQGVRDIMDGGGMMGFLGLGDLFEGMDFELGNIAEILLMLVKGIYMAVDFLASGLASTFDEGPERRAGNLEVAATEPPQNDQDIISGPNADAALELNTLG